MRTTRIFLGFAIERSPGYGRDGKAQCLLNKLDFTPITAKSVPKPSDRAPIQKFNWWDGGIVTADRGRQFTYSVTPVRGSGPNYLTLGTAAAGVVAVTVPPILDGKIASYFNRAVVSAQSFAKLTNGGASLEKQMDWLANGLQDAVSDILGASQGFDCAIYHLNDQRWVLPAFKAFTGKGSLVYFDKPADQTSQNGLAKLGTKPNISLHKRSRISGLMHDKFIVSYDHGRETSVLMGSNSENNNDENLLEISGNATLAQVYVAEFVRLYNHYRARALWNRTHPQQSGAGPSKSKNGAGDDPLVLASTRDGWVKGAYKIGAKEYVARERLL